MRNRRFALATAMLVLHGLAPHPGVGASEGTAATPPPNVRVSQDGWLAHAEPSIAVDPTDPDRLVAASKMFTTLQGGPGGYRFRVGTYYSHDGGRTWVDQGMLGGDEPGNSWAAQGYENTAEPTVAFDAQGNAYVAILAHRGTGQDAGGTGVSGQNTVAVYKSEDAGRTWLPPVAVAHVPPGASIAHAADRSWLAADVTGGRHDGNLYVTWTYTEVPTGLLTQNIYFSASSDGGQTWTRPHRIVSATAGQMKHASVPVVGPDGTVYVTFHDYVNGRLHLTKSTDAGLTWSPPSLVAAVASPAATLNGNLRSGPMITAAPAVLPNGTVVVAWNAPGGDGLDVVATSSTDGGATWSPAAALPLASRGDQFQPALAVTRGGTLWATWLDRRNDPANLLVDVYAAWSHDDGRTWTEERVTDVASDPRVGLPLDRNGRGFYGDHQGLAADDQTGAQILWNETRPGSQELFFARVNPRASRVTATRHGAVVRVSGRAGFRGQTAASAPLLAKDPTGDLETIDGPSPVPVEGAGIDLIGGKLYQPDPYVPRLAFEFHLAEPPSALPEVTQYDWNIRDEQGDPIFDVLRVHAKRSDVTSAVTAADYDPLGSVQRMRGAFRLRGDCGPDAIGVFFTCRHLAWLTGHFDDTRGIVRVFLPLSGSAPFALEPGSTIYTSGYGGAHLHSQLRAQTGYVFGDLGWLEDDPFYTVPVREAFIGVAPAGTPVGDVRFEPLALDEDDAFSAELAVGAGEQTVHVRTCFDGRCENTELDVP